jgi:hypothetical protein
VVLLRWPIAWWAGEAVGMKRRRSGPVVPFMVSAFAGYRFPPDVILLAVRWYLGAVRYRLGPLPSMGATTTCPAGPPTASNPTAGNGISGCRQGGLVDLAAKDAARLLDLETDHRGWATIGQPKFTARSEGDQRIDRRADRRCRDEDIDHHGCPLCREGERLLRSARRGLLPGEGRRKREVATPRCPLLTNIGAASLGVSSPSP